MDLFDHQQAYQRDLLRLIRTSPLLLHASCALAAQYLTLRVDGEIWGPIARERYGKGLRLLAETLQDPQFDAVHAVASTILLSSYELLAFPGDYYRSHFEGAKTLLESYSLTIMSSRLGIASFWIFARHDVNAALTHQIPTALDPRTWPSIDYATAGSDAEEDNFGNEMLRLAAELAWLVYGDSQPLEGPIAAEEWSRLRSALQEWWDVFFRSSMGSGKVASTLSNDTSYWFPTPAAASAVQWYHTTMLVFWIYVPLSISPDLLSDQKLEVQKHVDEIIRIGLSDLADGVLMQAVLPLFYAGKYTSSFRRRTEAIGLLQDLEASTGFQTDSKIRALRDMPLAS